MIDIIKNNQVLQLFYHNSYRCCVKDLRKIEATLRFSENLSDMAKKLSLPSITEVERQDLLKTVNYDLKNLTSIVTAR